MPTKCCNQAALTIPFCGRAAYSISKELGRVRSLDPASQEGIANEDVADTVLEVLNHDYTIRKTMEFSEGNISIEKVLVKSDTR